MTNPFKSKIDPRTARENISPSHRCLYLSVESLRAFVVAGEHALVVRAQSSETSGPSLWASGNYAQGFFGLGDSRLIEARNALAILEASAEYAEAKAIVAPILAALAELESVEAAAALARAQAEAEHRDALAAAEGKALETARKDPLVLKAAQALRALIGG